MDRRLRLANGSDGQKPWVVIAAELVRQAPATIAVIVVVVLFLQHLSTGSDVLRDVGDRSIDAINQNTQIQGEVREALHSIDLVLQEASDVMEDATRALEERK